MTTGCVWERTDVGGPYCYVWVRVVPPNNLDVFVILGGQSLGLYSSRRKLLWRYLYTICPLVGPSHHAHAVYFATRPSILNNRQYKPFPVHVLKYLAQQ